MHNVPVKLATEVGGGAGFVWVRATAVALQKYNRRVSALGFAKREEAHG